MSTVTDDIMKGNVCITNNKYLIFYVVDEKNDAVRTSCYGTIDSLPTVDSFKESVSVSSDCELSSNQNNGDRQEVL